MVIVQHLWPENHSEIELKTHGSRWIHLQKVWGVIKLSVQLTCFMTALLLAGCGKEKSTQNLKPTSKAVSMEAIEPRSYQDWTQRKVEESWWQIPTCQ